MFDQAIVTKVRRDRKATAKLRTGLGISLNEKDTENAYRAAFSDYFPSKTSSPFKVDGLLECDNVRSLLEFKHDLDLKQKIAQCSVLVQAWMYLKKFELAGKKMPTTVFVGDKNECFCIQSGVLVKYFNQPIDWNIAPSEAAKKHSGMLQALVDDQDILPFVFDINRKMFDFGEVIDQIELLGKGVIHQVKITRENCVEIFNYWRTHVLNDERFNHNQDLFDTVDVRTVTARQSDIFFACLTDRENTYLHPTKRNCLVSRGENVKVNCNQHRSFFAHFSQVLPPSELDVLVGSKDRIIEEVSRRRTGAFFTPTLWVAEAHKMLDESLGSNWRDEYVVWDCASGTNNLTRDFRFKELYCSTLEQGDVDTVRDMGYNKGSTVFQYDFLNDDSVDVLGDKVPLGLKKAFSEGKKVLFLINPPYGTANEMGTSGNHKSGIAKNLVNMEMITASMGSAAQQLYAQFLYKIGKLRTKYGMNNLVLGVFTNPSFMSCEAYKSFRREFGDSFSFAKGMLFQASNFADVSDAWGIAFTIWQSGRSINDIRILAVKKLNTNSFTISSIGNKTLYFVDGNNASNWFRETIKHLSKEDCPILTTAISVKKDIGGKISPNAIGCLVNLGNNVYNNLSGCVLSTGCMAKGHVGRGDIVDTNLNKAIALFCARKTIPSTWVNQKDEYLVPHAADPASPLHTQYTQWNNDALVYALFNTSSQQSSLRDVQYKAKTWQILNHFFFMDHKEMLQLADKANFNEMYQDAKGCGEPRYVFKKLQELESSNGLSLDAKTILEAARGLVRVSMEARKAWHADNPESNLQAWDAGFAQIKPMLKKMFPSQYKMFTDSYKAFENRMRKGVYEFGFLK